MKRNLSLLTSALFISCFLITGCSEEIAKGTTGSGSEASSEGAGIESPDSGLAADGHTLDGGALAPPCGKNEECPDGENQESSDTLEESSCGDETCSSDESCGTCPQDCGDCPAPCGDGVCQPEAEETCVTCPSDCEAETCCGDEICGDLETCEECPADCGECAVCGNGACETGENCEECAEDCGECPSLCGDGICVNEETCASCPVDCEACPGECGDGSCGGEETCSTCEEDCGPCPADCGDGLCAEETEDCSLCPDDCGVCACTAPETPLPVSGDTLCNLAGCSGDTVDCPLLLARETEEVEAASGLQFKINYDPSRLILDNFYDEVCFGTDSPVCLEVPLTKTGSQPNHTGHSFQTLPPGELPSLPDPGVQYLWNGQVAVVIVNISGTAIPISEAYLSPEGTLTGEAGFALARFTLTNDTPAETPTGIWLSNEKSSDIVGAGPSLLDLPASVQNGVIVTGAPTLP